jgi:hypothetical protein
MRAWRASQIIRSHVNSSKEEFRREKEEKPD